MSIIKSFFIFIFIVITLSCSIFKKKFIENANNDDYEIINLLFKKYTDTVFFNDSRTLFIVYEDSMLINNQILNKNKTNKSKIIILKNKKFLNKKFTIVPNYIFDLKGSQKRKLNDSHYKHKFKIHELYYNQTKTEAYLNYTEIVYTDKNKIFIENTHFNMIYKKENGKWVEIGNFYRGIQ